MDQRAFCERGTARETLWRLSVHHIPPKNGGEADAGAGRADGVIAGDAISALRESLDHLAWQLALLGCGDRSPFERTQFPVYWREGEQTEARLREVTQDIPDAAVEVIRSLQPYNRGEAYQSDPLWKIDKMWNVSKHQVIPVDASYVEFKANVDQAAVQEVVDTGSHEYVFVLTPEGSASLRVNPIATAGISFGSSRHDLILNYGDLRALHEYVRTDVFPRFGRVMDG